MCNDLPFCFPACSPSNKVYSVHLCLPVLMPLTCTFCYLSSDRLSKATVWLHTAFLLMHDHDFPFMILFLPFLFLPLTLLDSMLASTSWFPSRNLFFFPVSFLYWSLLRCYETNPHLSSNQALSTHVRFVYFWDLCELLWTGLNCSLKDSLL